MSRVLTLVLLLGSLTIAAPASAATTKTRIRVDVPAKVKAGKSFMAKAAMSVASKEIHFGALYMAKDDTPCPTAVPVSKKAWRLVADYLYDPAFLEGMVGIPEFGAKLTIARPGRHRFCGYVWTWTFTGSKSVRATKAHATKLVTVR